MRFYFCFFVLCWLGGTYAFDNSLSELEKLALEKAPELKESLEEIAALEAASVAVGQLKDPKLQVGVLNVPTDTFKLDQENMTQIRVGVMQEFPRGKSLHFASEAQKILAKKEQSLWQEKGAEIVKKVRFVWIELFTHLKAREILKENREQFSYFVEVTRSKLSSGSAFQHDVLRAQMELTKIEDRLLHNQELIEKSRISLARLVGAEIALEINPNILPKWSHLPNQEEILYSLHEHPLIQISYFSEEAANVELKKVEELYKPAWSAGIYYASRQGHVNSKKRADFVGVQLSTELPFFTKNRQSRKVTDYTSRYNAAKLQYKTECLNFQEKVSQCFVEYKKLDAKGALYEKRFLKEAKQYAESMLSAYENSQVDFDRVSDALDRSLEVSLQSLYIQSKKSQAHAEILYLEGKMP